MRIDRQLALSAYYAATLPVRSWQSRARCAAGQAPVRIMFYHRVADDTPNAWTIGTRAFRRQMEWVARRFDVVPLAEAQRRIARGHNQRPTACITFDDGYADNCRFAIPLLLRMGLPFTYFVATRHIAQGLPFPHDSQAGAPLRPNTAAEVRAMHGAGVEIGAHTRSHADLGSIEDSARLHDEIVGSVRDLHAMLDAPVRYFAFPFGLHQNLRHEAFAIARAAGLAGVCSAYGGYNFPGDDPFHLQRFHADPELIRLKNWLTIDPRKLGAVERYEYERRSQSRTPLPLQGEGVGVGTQPGQLDHSTRLD
ncbi:Polysaccharide deacetylase [Pirellulimonas nuda]|uniref:Polysaccharide deacetylase n=1 Tax=Pirellulimonas nuda TaxID=2528009 RepID=A0A518D7I3_9BACT|nr:polysaccharide deacetylase family protein [Pirellulimonas nuda]QDU87442.1 Polysaccharide deacetylase [Pirellulimonas nuda]